MTDSKPKESALLQLSPINISPPPLIQTQSDNKKMKESKENKEEKTKNDEKKEEKKEEKKIASKDLLNQHITQIIKSQFEEEEAIYEVDDTYLERLLEALKKEGVLRPTALFDGSDIDIITNEKDQKKEKENQKKEELKEEQKIKESDIKKTENLKKELEKNQKKLEEEQKEKKNQNEVNTHNRNLSSEELSPLNIKNKSSQKPIRTLDDNLAKFYHCTKVYIDQYYKISDMFVLCPLYYNYRISLEYNNPGEAYYLFDSIDLSPTCSHNFCPNQAKSVNMEIGSLGIGKGIRETFATFQKPYRCACLFLCACCTRPTLNVFINGNEKIGFIREIRTACDPTMFVFSKNNTLKFKIVGSCCQCGYCCRDLCCGMCNEAKFSIYHGRDFNEEKPEGFISKYKCSGNKVKPDYEQITIIYPTRANCYDKVLLLAATFFISILYYQNINNSKRCNGRPGD